MGKSDEQLHQLYSENASDLSGRVAVIGATTKPEWLPEAVTEVELYDLKPDSGDVHQLDINDSNWGIPIHSFDAVVATRVAYFAKSPVDFMEKIAYICKPGGRVMVDWGLGDHWRFKPYKIGWTRGDEPREWAYEEENYLWSTVWDYYWEISEPAVEAFHDWARKKREDLYGIELIVTILDEVPVVVGSGSFMHILEEHHWAFKALWPEEPQLYMLLNAKTK